MTPVHPRSADPFYSDVSPALRFAPNAVRVTSGFPVSTTLVTGGIGGRRYGASTEIGQTIQAKSGLRRPDLEQSETAVLNSLPAPSSQESYGHAIDEFIGSRNHDWPSTGPACRRRHHVRSRHRRDSGRSVRVPTGQARLARAIPSPISPPQPARSRSRRRAFAVRPGHARQAGVLPAPSAPGAIPGARDAQTRTRTRRPGRASRVPVQPRAAGFGKTVCRRPMAERTPWNNGTQGNRCGNGSGGNACQRGTWDDARQLYVLVAFRTDLR